MMNQLSQNSYMRPLTMDKQLVYTDEELIKRFQDDDEQAYVELVNRYRDRLMNFVYRFVNDYEQSQDIAQETLIKLYTHKHYYKNIAKFLSIDYWTTIVVYRHNKEISRSIGQTNKEKIYSQINSL